MKKKLHHKRMPHMMMEEEIEIKMPKKKKYKPSAKENKIHKVMHEFKEGELPIGKSKKKVTNRKQAIAIALNSAREMKGSKK